MDSELAQDLAIETLTCQFAAEMAQGPQGVPRRAEAEQACQEAAEAECLLQLDALRQALSQSVNGGTAWKAGFST